MAVYPRKIAEVIREPKFARPCDRSNGTGSDANFACGCFIRFRVGIDEAENLIADAGYETNGCGCMIAAAELIADHLTRKSLADLHGLTAGELDFVLGAIEHEFRSDCVAAVIAAVKDAFNDYRSKKIEEYSGEKVLICSCFGVSEETVEQFVRANRPGDPSDVADAIRAGGGCGSCRMLIQEIIDSSAR